MADLLVFLTIGGLITSGLAIRLNRYFMARRQWWQVLIDTPPDQQEQYMKAAYATLAAYRRDMLEQTYVPEQYFRVPPPEDEQSRPAPYPPIEGLEEFSRFF